MIWVVVNKETGGLARYTGNKDAPWTEEQAKAQAKKANAQAEQLAIQTRYEAREVEARR